MSDSDTEEFFDAQDVTPTSNSVTTRTRLVSNSETEITDDQMQICSQSRVKQDEEEVHVQNKPDDLDLRSPARNELEVARKAFENGQRRRKLEGMRQFIYEEDATSLCQPSQEVECIRPLGPVDLSTENTISPAFILTEEQQLEEKLKALSFELQQSGQCAAESDGDGQNKESRHNVVVNSTLADTSSLNKTRRNFDPEHFRITSDSQSSGLWKSNQSCTCSFNNSLNVLHKSGCKVNCTVADVIPPEVQPKSGSLPVDLSTYPSDRNTSKVIVYQEPDIIQSTKSLFRDKSAMSTCRCDEPGVLPDNLVTKQTSTQRTSPVAPPRRKKVTQSLELSSEAQMDSTEWTNDDKFCPADEFCADSRPSLDLTAATRGNCHVTAADDAAIKGLEDLSQDEVDDELGSTGSLYTQDDSDIHASTENVHNEQGSDEHALSSSQIRISRTKSKTLACSSLLRVKKEASSSQLLSDEEILEQVLMTNLDTGEKLPLSLAEDKVPKSINPLALHIMRRTKEFSSEKCKIRPDKSRDEQGQTVKTINIPKKKRKKLKKFLSKSVRKIKSELKTVKDDMFRGENSSSDEDEFVDGRRMIKIKASHSHKGPYDFDLLVPVQNLAEDSNGAVWTMKFSHCGKLLVTGGQDNLLRVWVLKSWYSYFDDMRSKYSEAANAACPQAESTGDGIEEEEHAPFMRSPFCVYHGHTADMLDVSWSKNYFILSSSMDKTVRLWHVSRKECLCCFQHIDFVTAIAFHPKDDQYFLSGSLDGKLRLWSIPEKKVALWNEVSGQSKLITAANFCSDGKIAVGTYDGRCILYTADHLDYHTQIHVRSTRGKNAKGGKITGVEPFPSENKILVTSNDSRIRLYDLRDKTLTCKYKGTINSSSRIKAVLNHDGRYIICGSEDGCIYIWKTQHDFYKFYSVRRDRNDFWEGIKAHTSVVTAAIFAPCPGLIIHPQFKFMDPDDKENSSGVRGEVIISADINGGIKVFINKFKPGSG